MGRALRTRQVMWVVGPVQSTVVFERAAYFIFGDQPTRLKPYYSQAVFSVDVFLKRPPATETLDNISIFSSMDGVRFVRPSRFFWNWETDTDLSSSQGIARTPLMHHNRASGAVNFRGGLFPEYWMLQYSATILGAVPQLLFIVSGAFTGSPPYGVE